jgi:hypothetical protein
MKKLFASVGLAALGVSTLHAQYSPGPTPAELAKPWSVAVTLRGFYDDNPLTINSGNSAPGALSRNSGFGEEISPSATFNHTVNDTALSLSYVFDWQNYETTDSHSDSSHLFNASVKQSFSERYSMQASDSFIIAQEPTVLDQSGPVASPLYTRGDNIHNDGTISFTAGLTAKLDLQLSYVNNLYAYQQLGAQVSTPNDVPSRSALLDRMEQLATVNLNWKIMNDLTGVLGYSYGHEGYTSPEAIIYTGTVPTVFSRVRDSDSHFFFVGADERFTQQLNGSIRVGGEYLDYYNANADDLSPYVDANLTWTYMADSSAQAGVKHEHSATDVVGALPTAGANPVLDSETTAAYLSLNQKITGAFTGGLLGQFQHSVFNGGSVNGQSEDFFVVGLNFDYKFNPYFSAETGYNWYKLVSDVSGRDYTRNMVYIGVRATY